MIIGGSANDITEPRPWEGTEGIDALVLSTLAENTQGGATPQLQPVARIASTRVIGHALDQRREPELEVGRSPSHQAI